MQEITTNPSGGFGARFALKTITADYQPRHEDFNILADATAANIVVRLKSSAKRGQAYNIKKTDSTAYTVTVQNKDGTNIAVLANQNASAFVQLGSNNIWYVDVIGHPTAAKDIHSNDSPALSAADGVNTTPSITETYITRILIAQKMKITGVKIFNGSDVTGNVRIGLATAAGAAIAAALTADTAKSGVDAYQSVPFAAAYDADPGYYHVCVQNGSATSRFNAHAWGTDWSIVKTGDVYGTMPTISSLPSAFVAAAAQIFSLY